MLSRKRVRARKNSLWYIIRISIERRRRWRHGVLTAGYFVTFALAAFLLISKAAVKHTRLSQNERQKKT